jgi:hypothetical protein
MDHSEKAQSEVTGRWIQQAPAGATEGQPGPATGFSLGRYYGWQIEVDIRSLKSAMQMDVLRCQTPEMVRKEIWAHLLAYNLLRTVMAVAAAENGIAAVPGQDHSGGPRDVRRLAGGAT